MLEPYAEDAVFDASAVFTDVAPVKGHTEMRRHWNEQREIWEGFRIEPLEMFELGGLRYVLELRLWGKGQRSGVEIDQHFAMLYTLRAEDGKIIRAQLFPDAAMASKAAESSVSQPA